MNCIYTVKWHYDKLRIHAAQPSQTLTQRLNWMQVKVTKTLLKKILFRNACFNLHTDKIWYSLFQTLTANHKVRRSTFETKFMRKNGKLLPSRLVPRDVQANTLPRRRRMLSVSQQCPNGDLSMSVCVCGCVIGSSVICYQDEAQRSGLNSTHCKKSQ